MLGPLRAMVSCPASSGNPGSLTNHFPRVFVRGQMSHWPRAKTPRHKERLKNTPLLREHTQAPVLLLTQ